MESNSTAFLNEKTAPQPWQAIAQRFCSIGDCKYSVPYEFIGKKVDIRVTENSIEVFYHNNRIASHVRRLYSPEPIYVPEHMPENHRKFLEYNTDSFLDWGKNVGCSTLIVVKHFYICIR